MTNAPLDPGLLLVILEKLPVGIAVFSPDYALRTHNACFVALNGMPTTGVGQAQRTDSWLDQMQASPEYAGDDGAACLAALRAWDRSRPLRLRRARANGQVIDSTYDPLPDGGFMAIVTEISALASLDDTALRQISGLAAILEHIPHGVCVYGPDRRVSLFNAAYSQVMAGAPVAIGDHADDITRRRKDSGEFGPPGEAETYAAITIAGINTGTSHSRRRVRPNGTVIDIRTALLPDGGYISVVTDITEARGAEDELRRAKGAAEAANQAKSRFLAAMSHELRTPLNAVIGFSEQLMRQADDPATPLTSAEITEFATEINSAGRQLLDQINTVLDVARIDSGRFDLACEPIDLLGLIEASVRQSDATARLAGIWVAVDVPASLPAVRGDSRRLAQAFSHLLSNAIKFSEIGGIIHIDASLEQSGVEQSGIEPSGDLLIVVRDTGIGIPAADLERVLEPFTQSDGTLSRRFQGAGLGLYISRALIEAHDGTLSLRSVPGAGTTAEIRLPRARLMPEDPTAPKENP